MQLLHRMLTFLLYAPKGVTGEAARFFIFQRIGYFIAASSHILWALVFWANAVLFMAWYNVVVAVLFVIGGILTRRMDNPFWLMVPLWFVEIPFHALLGTLHTGASTLFWAVPFASAMVAFLLYQTSWGLRAAISALMMLLTAGICLTAFFVAPWSELTFASQITLFLVNFFNTICGIVMYIGLNQYQVMVVEQKLTLAHDRAEGLLRNILPEPIALRLKDGETVIADEHDEVSVIFADIVNFTQASATLRPAELVETLNMVFTEFDHLAAKHGAEKIKTIGDAYMAVIGVPEDNTRHAQVAVELALDMLASVRHISAKTHFPIELRIGINSGPVVAGVIGESKFAYDLWGDAVNVASRMEAHSEPGTIMITESIKGLLPDRFDVQPLGLRDIKGKGQMSVFAVAQHRV